MPMQHFHRTIKGWNAFAQFYVDAVQEAPKRGAHFAEIGSYFGRSAAFMAVTRLHPEKHGHGYE